MSRFSWRHKTILVAARPETWQFWSRRELHFSLLDERLSILVATCCYEAPQDLLISGRQTRQISTEIRCKIRWQAQIQIQIKIKTRGNSIVYILYYIYCVIYLNKSEDVECCLFTSMFRVSTHQMGFHHRENVNVQHFKICKNLIFTLSPTQTWVIPCQICMFFLDPLIKCYFCVLSSKLGPLWCLSGKCGHPCPFMRTSSIMGTF